jgi:hypothetical protein
MSKSLERFRRELQRTWRVRGSIDWINPDYSAEKAYIMAIFSKVAYLVIPHYELAHHSLAKIIPCLTYHDLLASRRRLIVEHEVKRLHAELVAKAIDTVNRGIRVGENCSSKSTPMPVTATGGDSSKIATL